MEIAHVWVILAAILVLAHIWALVRVLKSRSKTDNKGVWIVVLAAVPLLGLLLWIFCGPKGEGDRKLESDRPR